jgi:hypothetical protein
MHPARKQAIVVCYVALETAERGREALACYPNSENQRLRTTGIHGISELMETGFIS